MLWSPPKPQVVDAPDARPEPLGDDPYGVTRGERGERPIRGVVIEQGVRARLVGRQRAVDLRSTALTDERAEHRHPRHRARPGHADLVRDPPVRLPRPDGG